MTRPVDPLAGLAGFREHRVAAPDGLPLYVRDYGPKAGARLPLSGGDPELEETSGDIRAMAALGSYYADKIRGAARGRAAACTSREKRRRLDLHRDAGGRA